MITRILSGQGGQCRARGVRQQGKGNVARNSKREIQRDSLEVPAKGLSQKVMKSTKTKDQGPDFTGEGSKPVSTCKSSVGYVHPSSPSLQPPPHHELPIVCVGGAYSLSTLATYGDGEVELQCVRGGGGGTGHLGRTETQ